MKRYSFKIRDLRNNDISIKKFKEEMDVLMSSERFIDVFKVYVEDISLYRKVNGNKYKRSMDYAHVGIMDQNDIIQEGYLAFLEAYSNIDWDKIEEAGDDGAMLWGFLKKSTILNFERQVRGKKDGIRIPERAYFESNSVNTNLLTKLFGSLELVFSNNVQEVALTRWETDLVGAFLDVHMDEYLDKKPNGTRNLMGIERRIIKDFYGLDTIRKSSKEIAAELNKGYGTIDVIRKRALDKLKISASKEKIADFLTSYRIFTGADIKNI